MRGRARGTDFALSMRRMRLGEGALDRCVAGGWLWRLGRWRRQRSAVRLRARIDRHHRLLHVFGPFRSEHAAHLLDRHHARRMEQHPGRVPRHRDPDGQGQRLRRRSHPVVVPHGERDGRPTRRSSCTASRPGRRRSCSTARARRCSSTSRFTSAIRSGNFHGVEKLVFDMTRDDWTFMHDRLAHTWFRQAGSPPAAPPARASRSTAATTGCSSPRRPPTSASSPTSSPTTPTAICGRRGRAARNEQRCPNQDRLATFKNATDIAAVAAIVDLDRLGQANGRARR